MLKLLKKEYERLILKGFKNYIANSNKQTVYEALDSYFNLNLSVEESKIWLDYLFKFANSPAESMKRLKDGLDEKSISFIDIFFDRVMLKKSMFYYNPGNIFTEEELCEQKITGNSLIDFKYKQLPYVEESVAKYHSGLKLLPEEIIRKLEGKDFVDGGAYIGDSALVFMEYKPNKIYSFEPCEENFQTMKKNIAYYNLDSTIIPVKSGLGDKKTTVMASGNDLIFSVNNDSSDRQEEIEITTIDSFIEENNVDLGLIKLDVEGYELETIKGAIESIKKFKPVLLISIYHCPKDFFEIKPLLDDLNLGYKFMVRKLNNSTLTHETMLIGHTE